MIISCLDPYAYLSDGALCPRVKAKVIHKVPCIRLYADLETFPATPYTLNPTRALNPAHLKAQTLKA